MAPQSERPEYDFRSGVTALIRYETCAILTGRSGPPFPNRMVSMRTLGASLVAFAAIAASLSLARHRPESREPNHRSIGPALSATVALDLDGIRAAGL